MKIIGATEAAKRLNVNASRVRALIDSGRLKAIKVGREWLIGSEGVAVTSVDPDGVVRIGEAQWRARTNRATPIMAGEPMRVAEIDGITLEVEPLEGAAKDYRERRAKTPE